MNQTKQKYKIVVSYDYDENEFVVFCEGISDLCGYGETESSALLDFLAKYEKEYSGFNCFRKEWVQKQISILTMHQI